MSRYGRVTDLKHDLGGEALIPMVGAWLILRDSQPGCLSILQSVSAVDIFSV